MREIAVVGMACRLPGGLDNLELLLNGMRKRVVTAGPVPADRWDAKRYYAKDESAKGRAYVDRANFLQQDIRAMDGEFFDLPPRVAENIDPQQRLLLELIWEAFENAGLDLTAHAGRNVGVYMGGFMLDHMVTQMQTANRARHNANTAAGMMMTMLSNRLSHMFDLRGPSLSIDTACSSSLVAFSYACRDIWAGVCDMAVVGGANVMTRPEYAIGMSKGQFLSRDGQCKSFDARGDGYGRGEGAGIVLLKTLEKALADGDTILATVAGAGVNSDGRTPGISMPSGEAQSTLIREVCERHGIDPTEVRYVECHGTGTAVGDPIEAEAIGRIYGVGRSADKRVTIGSVKSNIGHLEAAAGVAGVIKAVLTLQHREVFALGNLQTPHPGIRFEELGVRLADSPSTLAADGEPCLVAVNSFGYGGTNAHVVLRSAPVPRCGDNARDRMPRLEGFPLYLPISARHPGALRALARQYGAMLAQPDTVVADVLHSAAHRRAALSHRAVVIGEDLEALREGLDALARGEKSERVVAGQQPAMGREESVWVFTGMGPQWWAMGQQLYREEPVYRRAVDEADAIFQRIAGFSVLTEMLKDEAQSQITRTQFAQPANFILQWGLVAMLRAAGATPGAVVGHSVGEVTSACVSGALSLEDALRVSHSRSRLQARLAGTGSMLAVGLGARELAPLLEPFGGRVEIAAINAPATITLAGETLAIRQLAAQLAERDVFHRLLTVEVPYHSHLMAPILGELETALAPVAGREPVLPVWSTVTGARACGPSFGAGYWPRNVREPVAFMAAIESLLDEGYTTFVEVGPHPVLASAIRECAQARAKEVRLVETLRRTEPERARVQRSVAQIFASGTPIDWRALNGEGRFVALPNYPWQRERLWLETERAAYQRVGSTDRPLLGCEFYPATHVWLNDLEHEALAYLRDHVVSGTAIMPAAGYLETMLEAAATLHADAPGWRLSDVSIHAPLVLSTDRALDYLAAFEHSTRTLSVRSSETGRIGEGQLHLSGTLDALVAAERADVDLAALREEYTDTCDSAVFYRGLARLGLQYGPAFQPVRALYRGDKRGSVLARVELPADLASDGYRAHPAMLDGCFQVLVGMLDDHQATWLPTAIKELRLLVDALPTRYWCHAAEVARTARHIDSDLRIIADDGRVLAVLRGLRVTAAAAKPGRTDSHGDPVKLQMVQYAWSEAGHRGEPRRMGRWLVVEARGCTRGVRVARALEAFGAFGTVRLHAADAAGATGNCYGVRTDSSGDLAQALEEIGPLDGVVFVNGTPAQLASADPVGTQALTFMAQVSRALALRSAESRPRAYVMTQGAFQLTERDAPVEPAQTALNGFARVAFSEIEGMRFSTIDLSVEASMEDFDSAMLELLCDAPEDEVAIRAGQRYVSQLSNDLAITQARISPIPLTQARRVLVRPLAENEAGEGLVKLVETPPVTLGEGDVELRVEHLGLTLRQLDASTSEAFDGRFVEAIGTVSAVGASVVDLKVGMRVYGLVPADFASHVHGPHRDFHVVELPADVAPRAVLFAAVRAAVAERLAQQMALGPGACVLVVPHPLGVAVAAALQRRGVEVVRAPSGDNGSVLCGDVLEELMASHTAGAGFDAIVAPLAQWGEQFGWRVLAEGGGLVDIAAHAMPFAAPAAASFVLRADLAALAGRTSFDAALRDAVARAARGELVAADVLPVSLADLATRKLAMPQADLSMIVSFDSGAAALPVQVHEAIALRADATYLVTGGLGGFGQKTAAWLVDRGARHLVLAGRSGATTPERRAFVEALEAQGVDVTCVASDLSDAGAVRDLFEMLHGRPQPLRGVFHAAAVIIDEPVSELSAVSLDRVMRAKALSACLLHEHTLALPLDYFVLYSSIANLVGNSRQASYVAANGFLDGLAWRRRALGLPATSINWGAIEDTGVIARDEKLAQFMRYMGLRGMQTAEALHWLERALARDVVQLGVMLITNWTDWARFETLGGTSPRFAALIAADLSADTGTRERLREELEALAPRERFAVLAGLVCALVADELDMSMESIALDRPILDYGVDSLMATEIQLLMDRDLGVAVSVLEILDGLTVRRIVERTLGSFGWDDSVHVADDKAA
ncbi:type I polyketide synthase [Paraburkholderia bannensis]|uniref:type I polyketide synthase n=1 Tax=Paraburkholderia bannensis TaxID=765414 RepID=UPI0004857507|nr:type I polyketide synthase [Paraburkholderia bannensis]